jgi:hypothetical protein
MWGTLHLKNPRALALADSLSYVLLLLLSFLVTLSYYPFLAGSEVAGVLHGTIAVVFLLLFGFSQLDKQLFSCRTINICWILLGLVVISGLTVYAWFGNAGMKSEIRSILIPLCALMVGWQLKMDDNRLIGLILVFTLGIIVVGVSLIFLQGSGFSISETYFADQKNAVGPMMATAAILCAGTAFGASGKRRAFLLIAGMVLALFCVVMILTIRARAALLAAVVVIALMLFHRYKNKYLLLSFWGAIILVVAVFLLLPQSIKQYVYQSLFSGFSGGDITSGRMIRNQQAIQVLAENPLFGQLLNAREVGIVHNYPLIQVLNYGLLMAAPLLVLYFYLLFVDLKAIVTKGVRTMGNVGFYAMLVIFVVSLFEYSFPYGPGTTTVVNFILFGIGLQNLESPKNYDRK